MPYQGRLPYTYKSPYNTTLDQGTQTVPSLAFLGDTNNGVFSPATDNVAITTNGSEKLRVTDTGLVGIGTTNPPLKLTVVGNIRAGYDANIGVTLGLSPVGIPTNDNNSYILWGDANSFGGANGDLIYIPRTSTDTSHRFYTGTTTPQERVRITSTGNIGIGTINPSSKLHVYNGDLELTGGYNLTWGGTFSGGNPTIWGNSSNKTIRFAPDGNTTGLVALLGASSSYILGNVGIGTTNPSVKFEVWDGQTTLSGRAKANTGTTLRLTTTDASNKMELLFDHSASNYWRLQSVEQGVAYRPLILQNDGGNVGIGVTNPTSKLTTLTNSNDDGVSIRLQAVPVADQGPRLIFGHNTNNGVQQIFAAIKSQMRSGNDVNWSSDLGFYVGGSSLTQAFTIASTGNVGIGTTNPAAQFHVGGSASNNNPWGVFDISDGYFKKLHFSEERGAYGLTGYGGYIGYDASANTLTLGVYENSAENRSINIKRDNGNVGIGTTNPGSKLVLTGFGDNNTLRFADGAFEADIGYVNNTGNLTIQNWNDIIFRTGSSTRTEKVRILSTGNVGIGTTNPVKSLDVRGEATFGAGITTSDLAWGKDTNQLVYTFSGVASGVNPADGTIALVNPNTNPSATRIGSLVFGNKVSGPSATSNPGIKAGIECGTNTNVANAADTGALLNFYTKPDNGTFRVQMTLNSNGVLTKPYQPAFFAYRNTALSHPSGWQLISNDILTESYDVGPVYSTSTNGRFVAPVTGKYMFYAGGFSSSSTSGERYSFGVKINNSGSPDFIAGGNYSLVDSPLAAYQVVLHLNANDYVELYFFSAIATTLGAGSHPIYWGGYLLG